MAALERGGHQVMPVSVFRSFDADGNAVDMGSGLVDILAGAFQSFQKNKFDKEETDATD